MKKEFYPVKVPKRKPDQISSSGSQYWYGEDKNGSYTIRFSNHFGYCASTYFQLPKKVEERLERTYSGCILYIECMKYYTYLK
ncbi:MAG: hypothetical protein WC011_00510 [Candidatus Paceibacterota bacterium]